MSFVVRHDQNYTSVFFHPIKSKCVCHYSNVLVDLKHMGHVQNDLTPMPLVWIGGQGR